MDEQDKNLTFNELLPKIIDRYELPAQEMSALHPLADQANRLTPAFSQLSENIWTGLPITDFEHVQNHTELAKQAAVSTGALHAKQNDVKTFAEAICFEAIELRVRGQHMPDAKLSALRSAREPLCRAVQQVNRPLEPVLTAELMAQPLEVIVPQVNQWFRNSSHTVAAHLLLSMHVLVQLDVIGLVEWPGETTCKLNFFKHVVTQDQVKRQRSQTIERSDVSDGEFQSVRLETWEHIEGRNRYAIERHEHHVMNAELNPTNAARYPIPEDKQAFLNRVPPWIKQHLRILEGDLILEKVDRRHVSDELWQTTPQLRSSYELEPAIVLGHYVITGWGQKEIEKEAFRRKRIADTPSQPESDPTARIKRREAGKVFSQLRPWTIAVAVAAIASMFFCWLQPAVMIPISLVLAGITIVLGTKTAMEYSNWRHNQLDVLFVAAATTALAAATVALMTGFYGLIFARWGLLLLCLPLGVVTKIAKSIAISRME